MKCNVGGIDRIARIVFGVVLLGVGIFVELSMVWKIVAFAVAGVMFLTATIHFCPINSVIGLNTCTK